MHFQICLGPEMRCSWLYAAHSGIKAKTEDALFCCLVNPSTLFEMESFHCVPSHALNTETWLTNSQKKTQTHFADTHARVNLHTKSKQLLVLWLAWRGLEGSLVTVCVCAWGCAQGRVIAALQRGVGSHQQLGWVCTQSPDCPPTWLEPSSHTRTQTHISQTYRCTETQTLTYTHYDSE